MNHIYRLVWNRALCAFRAVSELARGQTRQTGGKRALCFAVLLGWLPLPLLATVMPVPPATDALPTGGQVTAGAGHIAQGGSTLTVTQQSQHLSLNWQSFDIGRNATVDFVQPNASAIAVNRVPGTDASRIFGHLNANGQVFLINPNGIVFGKSAQVNVGGLVASTLDLDDASLGRGSLDFRGDSQAGVTNLGSITVHGGGYVALLGHQVANQGTIHATLGSVALAGGNAVTLRFDGDALAGVEVAQSQLDALAENGQLIAADGGQVWMTAGARDSLLASAVNNTGTVEARTVQNHAGTITLLGGMAAGTVNMGGTLDASAPDGGDGGFIETSAARVNMADAHRVTTLAANGRTGTWLIDPTDFTIAPSGGNETGAQLGADLESTDISLLNTQGNININDDVAWGSSHTLSISGPSTVNITNAINAPNGNLAISVTGDINEGASGSLVIGGTSDFTASGSAFLGSAGNSFNVIRTLDVPNGSVVLSAANGTLSLPLTTVGGDFTLATGGTVSATAAVTVGGAFDLLSGHWVQDTGPLPAFSATDFRIKSGASFLRADGGNGSSATPYRITDVYGLQGMASADLLGDAFVLANDIDASGTANWNATGPGSHAGFRPIGDGTNGFTGSLDGQGHAISGLYIDRADTDYIGLFGYTGSGSSLGNLALDNVSITASGDSAYAGSPTGWYVGALAGYSASSISKVSASGSVGGVQYVGGLVGYQKNGSIGDSHADVAVTGLGNVADSVGNSGINWGFGGVGGLVGSDDATTISNSYATGSVTTSTLQTYNSVGGLVGINDGSIAGSAASGTVQGANKTGGLAGANSGSISRSYATGNATGNQHVGGLVGYNQGSISDAYATGGVSGNDYLGGLVGYDDTGAVLSNVYATGGLTGGGTYRGGLVGANDSNNVTHAYYATDTAGDHPDFGGGTGMTLAGLMGQGVLDTLGGDGAWANADGHSTPYFTLAANPLKAVAHVENDGTTLNTIVRNVDELQAIDQDLAGHYALGNDIDASATASWNGGQGFVPLGDGSSTLFSGAFDGFGHAIDSLTIDRPDTSYVGLFGYVGSGSLRNVSLVDASVSGYTYVGALAGYNNAASISGSASSGNVHGGNDVTDYIHVGGLVGGNNTGDISDSYSTANVSNNATYGQYFGGLVGSNTAGHISDSWASGTVGGYISAGGLAGYNGGSIKNSYASGYVDGNGYGGGLVGTNDGSIVDSYSSGGIRVSGSGATNGGLVGTNNGSLSGSFWNSDALANGTYSGSSTGATGKSLAELKQLSTFIAAGWDIDDAGGTGKTWRIYDGDTTPLLRGFLKPLTVGATPDYDGSGTALANIGSATLTYDASADPSHVLGTPDGDTLTLSSTAAGYYTATSNIDLDGLYSDQLGYDLSHGSTTRAISTPGSAAGDIELPGNITWTSGTLVIDTSGSVVTGSSGVNTTAIDGDAFRLAQGNWVQEAASLPAFSVADFGIGSGREAPNATFLRVLGGNGSAGNPYRIADVYGLQGLNSQSLLGDAFVLANDIDASGTAHWNAGYNADGSAAGFIPIGTDGARFSGSLDGQYHVISGLASHLPGEARVGLFGATGTATVQKLGLENVAISGHDQVGGVIGESQGASVSEVYVTGSLSGYQAIGGIVGENQGGSLDNVYSSASVADTYNYAGGLVGINGGSLDHGYFDGHVSGPNPGALVSHNADASGGRVSHSFWNTDTSGYQGVISSDTPAGLTTLFGGSYETTAQMQQLATFTAAGWDISDVGGDGSVWRIYDGATSPLLRGFLTAATVTVDGSQGSKAYDGLAASGPTGTYTATLAGGGAADTSLLSGTLGYATTGANANGYTLANGDLVLSGLYSGQRGYDISYAGTASYTIGKAGLVVTVNDAAKTYDGAAWHGGNEVSYAGFADGENALVLSGSLAYGGSAQGAVNAGNYTITAGGLTSGNYAITYVDGTLAVARKALTGSITANDKVYDGTTTATTSGTLLGVIAGDTVAFDTSGHFADKNAGTGKTVNVNGSLSGADAGNYTLTGNATTTADITPKAISGSITADDKIYDGGTSATTSGTLLGMIAGDTVAFDTSGSFADKNAGTGKTVSVNGTLSGADAGNYTLTGNATTTATITPKAIAGSISANDKVYDGTTTATTSGTLLGVLAGDTVALDTSGSFADKNAGTGKTVTVSGSLSGADAGNYTLNGNAATTADITPATLTYVATPVQWPAGTPMPALGGDVTGFVGRDTLASATTGTAVFTTTATAQSDTGSYAVDGDGLVAIDGNYVFQQAPGNATALSVTGGVPVTPPPSLPSLPVLAYLQSQLGRPAPTTGLLAGMSIPGTGAANGTSPVRSDMADTATSPYAPDVRVVDGGVRLP